MDNEIWKDIIGYDGLYQVSNKGNIKSFKKDKNGKLLMLKIDKDGYKNIGLRDANYIRKFKRVHRLVAEAFIENSNSFTQINHKDNNPANNYVENLEWCSVEYNNKYRFSNGNASHKGSKHPQATITEDVAVQIFELGHSGLFTESQLAKKFNTTRSVINKIRLSKSWTHVTNNIIT